MQKKLSTQNRYKDLRSMTLGLKSEQLHLNKAPDEVFGVLMDWHFTEICASLAVIEGGPTSLYFSSGACFIGGEKVAELRKINDKILTYLKTNAAALNWSETAIEDTGEDTFVINALTDSGIRYFSFNTQQCTSVEREIFDMYQQALVEFRILKEQKESAQTTSTWLAQALGRFWYGFSYGT